MFLSKRLILVSIPIIVITAAIIYMIPVQNIMSIQEHKYDCKTNAMYLQLENGTMIPCKNNIQASTTILFGYTNSTTKPVFGYTNSTSFNTTKP